MKKSGGYYGRGVPTPIFLEYTGIQYGFVMELQEINENDAIIEIKINIYICLNG